MDTQQEFQQLLNAYHSTVRTTSGCGSRGQMYINGAHEALQNFAQEHPEYKSEVPRKENCSDDGAGGFSTGRSRMRW